MARLIHRLSARQVELAQAAMRSSRASVYSTGDNLRAEIKADASAKVRSCNSTELMKVPLESEMRSLEGVHRRRKSGMTFWRDLHEVDRMPKDFGPIANRRV